MAKIETMKVDVTNQSGRGKVLRVHGGTFEVPSYSTVENLEILTLEREQIEAYARDHQLILMPAGTVAAKAAADAKAAKKAGKGKGKPSREDLDAAVADAEAALAKAKDGNDLAAIAAAEQALDDAKRAAT